MSMIIIQDAEDKQRHVHYEVNPDIPPLGTGGMGQVRRGIQKDELTKISRDVAIKFLFDDLPQSSIERSRREASIHIKNENLVEMIDFVTTGSSSNPHYHVVSELLEGVMLFDMLHGTTIDGNGKRIDYAAELLDLRLTDVETFAIKITKSVLSGVMALHDMNYIHRDIDPSNIMLTVDRKIKLIDFGIARNRNSLDTGDRQLTSAGQFMGKAAYAAPELVLGDVTHQDETTDIYAIGIMLFQLITGKVPFDGATHEVLEMQLKEKIPLKEIHNKALRKIVEKATAKKQSDRYPTAASMRVALEEVERTLRSSKTKSTNHTTSGPYISLNVKNPFKSSSPSEKSTPAQSNVGKPVSVQPNSISSPKTEIKPGKSIDTHSGTDKIIVKPKRKNPLIIIGSLAVVAIVAVIIIILNNSNGQSPDADKQSIASTTVKSPTQTDWHVRLSDNNTQPKAEYDALLKDCNQSGKNGASALMAMAALQSRQDRLLPKTVIDKYASVVPEDLEAAHYNYMQAIKKDSTLYKAYYEIGANYLEGVVVPTDYTIAADYMKRGMKQAQNASDHEYVEKFKKALDLIGI